MSPPLLGAPLTKDDDPLVETGHHADGRLLPEARFGDWQFGVLQDRLVPSGLMAFVKLPSGDEATLLWDESSPEFVRVEKIASEAGYLGAFRVGLGFKDIESRAGLVQQLEALLPLLKAQLPQKEGR
ncbi:hypothetical protein J2W49_004674 [Hydrogenophaga palleronii]|uniref:PilZ domain-containing protein n=1 Tax=Hydrogenophaga palleronii TaxID=65655 RepID=A0ABU1WTR8_9BURK|nr:hypothetical protein [Hydrogenophaga palleronii]MDR7152696.1 hypothetical protein [Hydrogenophaga palleronii]